MKISERHELYAKEILAALAKNPALTEKQKQAKIVSYLNEAAQNAVCDYVTQKVAQDLPTGRSQAH
jgi:hypothetical protein